MADHKDDWSDEERSAAIGAWLATRPECVRKLAAEFPGGTVLQTPEGDRHVIGWTENDMLIVSPVDPHVDYDGAREAKEYLHARCVRDAMKEKPT